MSFRVGETLTKVKQAFASVVEHGPRLKGLSLQRGTARAGDGGGSSASRLARLRAWLAKEKGAVMFVVIAVTFGLLLFTPILIDYASLHFARRMAQTAADSAALAAAVECSDAYSLDTGDYWWDDRALVFTTEFAVWPACCTCWTSDMCPVATYYTLRVLMLANSWTDCGGFKKHGEEYAEDYAQMNRSELVDYTISPFPVPFYHLPRVKFVAGLPVASVQFRAEVTRKVPMIYEVFYGQTFEVHAHAVAEAYLDDYDTGTQLCAGPCKPWVGTVTTYDFKWKVRLVQ